MKEDRKTACFGRVSSNHIHFILGTIKPQDFGDSSKIKKILSEQVLKFKAYHYKNIFRE